MTAPQGVLFVNPGSGPAGSPGAADIRRALPDLRCVDLDDPTELPGLVRRAVADGVDLIAVAGGDGTIRCAAEVMAGTSASLLAVPAGTRNHFAREVGIESLEQAAEALMSGHRHKVSVGFVNGRAFVNNASIGLYPALVRRRERSSLSKTAAGVTAAVSLLRHARPLAVDLDGERHAAWLVFVGNGRYGDGFTDLVERRSLDEGVLDVRCVRSSPRWARLRVSFDALVGRVDRSRLVVRLETAALDIGIDGRHLDVALDGEVVDMVAPLRFEARRSALGVVSLGRQPAA